MAKECKVTGKRSRVGGSYSNAIRATKFNPLQKARRQPNMQKKTLFVPELGKRITVTLSTKGIKTLNKNGVYQTLKKAGII